MLWQVKTGRDTLAAEVPPEEQGAQARPPVLGRRVLMTSGCEKPVGVASERDGGQLGAEALLLRGLCMGLLWPQHTGGSSKITKDLQGGIKLMLQGWRIRSNGRFHCGWKCWQPGTGGC